MNNTENNQTNINNENINSTSNASSQAPKKKKSKAKGAIIALVVALILCIIVIIGLVVLGALGVLGVGVAGMFMFNKTETQNAPEVTVVETVEITTEIPTTEEAIVTEPEVSEVYGDYITSPEEYYGTNSYYITYDTPAHAGVNLRETPEDDSVKIMVLPEGTTVTRLFEPGETTETKYVLVRVEVDGVEYTGYVMQRYVSTFSGATFDSYVSYNTPSHAGLVLRETADGNSEKIMVIPEGTQLRVVDNTTGAYWAVDAFYNGGIYSGYVLAKYIESNY